MTPVPDKTLSAKSKNGAQPDQAATPQAALDSGRAPATLNDVKPPKAGVSDAVKQAFLEDQKEKQK